MGIKADLQRSIRRAQRTGNYQEANKLQRDLADLIDRRGDRAAYIGQVRQYVKDRPDLLEQFKVRAGERSWLDLALEQVRLGNAPDVSSAVSGLQNANPDVSQVSPGMTLNAPTKQAFKMAELDTAPGTATLNTGFTQLSNQNAFNTNISGRASVTPSLQTGTQAPSAKTPDIGFNYGGTFSAQGGGSRQGAGISAPAIANSPLGLPGISPAIGTSALSGGLRNIGANRPKTGSPQEALNTYAANLTGQAISTSQFPNYMTDNVRVMLGIDPVTMKNLGYIRGSESGTWIIDPLSQTSGGGGYSSGALSGFNRYARPKRSSASFSRPWRGGGAGTRGRGYGGGGISTLINWRIGF